MGKNEIRKLIVAIGSSCHGSANQDTFQILSCHIYLDIKQLSFGKWVHCYGGEGVPVIMQMNNWGEPTNILNSLSPLLHIVSVVNPLLGSALVVKAWQPWVSEQPLLKYQCYYTKGRGVNCILAISLSIRHLSLLSVAEQNSGGSR